MVQTKRFGERGAVHPHGGIATIHRECLLEGWAALFGPGEERSGRNGEAAGDSILANQKSIAA
jgi:hypothetical protein